MLSRRGYRDIHVYDRLPEPPAVDSSVRQPPSSAPRTCSHALQRRTQPRLPHGRRSPDDAAPRAQVWGDGRNYNVGLSGRGQKALKDLGVWADVEEWCVDVVGRIDWSPGSSEPKTSITKGEKGYTTKIIQRDRLASSLLRVLRESYPDVRVNFGVSCKGLDIERHGTEGERGVATLLKEGGALMKVRPGITLVF